MAWNHQRSRRSYTTFTDLREKPSSPASWPRWDTSSEKNHPDISRCYDFWKYREKNGETNIWLSRWEMAGNFGRCLMFVSFLWLVWQPVFVGFSAPEKYSRRPIGIGGLAKPHDFECEKPMAFWNSSLLKSDFQKRTVVWKKHQQKYECGCVFFCKFPLPSNIVSKFSQSFVDFGRCLGQWGMPSQTFGPFFTMWMTSAEERWMGKHGLL